ncbi:hypothetical protein QE409_000224 [Klebsiella sp. SORGH_AS 1173]|nr:hypothetical protein [Klebsiella sp. SORGH_AS_1173]
MNNGMSQGRIRVFNQKVTVLFYPPVEFIRCLPEGRSQFRECIFDFGRYFTKDSARNKMSAFKFLKIL